jgi:hypothetical protein
MASRPKVRVLTPVQRRAIALRVQGLDITAIAREVGRSRSAVSRWLSQDPLVVLELERQVWDMQQAELQRFAGLRWKALQVVETAIENGDVRAALAVLRQAPRSSGQDHKDGRVVRSTEAIDSSAAGTAARDREAFLDDVAIAQPWQGALRRAEQLLGSARPADEETEPLDQLLLLEDVGADMVWAFEEAEGEGLNGCAPLPEPARRGHLRDASEGVRRVSEILLGPDDEDAAPEWPGDEDADRAITLLGAVLACLLSSLDGAVEALQADGGPEAGRVAARLALAHEGGALVQDGTAPATVADRARSLATLTGGFHELVLALIEGATLDIGEPGAAGVS